MEQTQCKLIDICNIQYGYAFDSKKFTDNSNNIALIRIRDVKAGKSYTYYSGDYDNTYIVNTGDILIGMDGEFNIAKWKSKPALLNQRVCKLIPSEKINSDYLLYYLSVELKKIETKTAFVTVKHLSAKELNSLKLEVPNLQMQEKIAQRLIYVQKLIELGQKQIDSYNILIKSRFVEMFGNPFINPMRWKKMRLGDVCDVRDGTHDSPRYYDIGYPLLTSKNVTSGIIDLNDCNYISESDYFKINERSKVDIGDIIMPMIGTVGKPVIVNVEPNFAIKNVALIKFNNTSIVDNIYVKVFLESEYFDKSVLSKIRGGTQKFIALGDIRKLEILLPTIDKQQEFRDFVYQVDKLKVEEQQRLEKAQMLFDSLMQQYFG